MPKYSMRINGGDEISFDSERSQYSLAAMEAFGRLSLPYPCEIEIWVPHLLPDYGPYFYRIGDFVDASGRAYVTPSVQGITPTWRQPEEGEAALTSPGTPSQDAASESGLASPLPSNAPTR